MTAPSVPPVIAVYSETGGATKTTTAVSLAVCLSLMGHRVDLIDLDPRGAATKWLGVTPEQDWQHVGAILGNPDPTGWVNDLALGSPWPEVTSLRVVPAARSLSNREKATDDHSDIRLRLALTGSTADITVLDLPNRQGGPLILNALTAATTVVYAAKLDEDGLDGVDGAATTVRRFLHHRAQLGAPAQLTETGIAVGGVRDTVMTHDSRRALAELDKNYGELVLRPLIPERVIVREARAAGEYFGFGGYPKGVVVHDAYMELTRKVLP
jgi:cellulose biosynthesis protein BcsQ